MLLICSQKNIHISHIQPSCMQKSILCKSKWLYLATESFGLIVNTDFVHAKRLHVPNTTLLPCILNNFIYCKRVAYGICNLITLYFYHLNSMQKGSIWQMRLYCTILYVGLFSARTLRVTHATLLQDILCKFVLCKKVVCIKVTCLYLLAYVYPLWRQQYFFKPTNHHLYQFNIQKCVYVKSSFTWNL